MKLEDIHKDYKYEVPEEYFDTLALKVLKRAQTQPEAVKLKTVKLGKYLKPLAAAAALIVGLIIYNITDTQIDTIENMSYSDYYDQVLLYSSTSDYNLINSAYLSEQTSDYSVDETVEYLTYSGADMILLADDY